MPLKNTLGNSRVSIKLEMQQPELNRIYAGDALQVLKTWPDSFVHCVVCSPPYWGLRDYGVAGQFGLEKTPEEYVAKMVEIFREVRRILRDDGTLWLNLGDSHAGSWGNYHPNSPPGKHGQRLKETQRWNRPAYDDQARLPPTANCPGLKPKDLCGIPWRVVFALQADGWWLRSDIIWSKPNPMPESVTDRPTRAHEYLFLLAKSARYFYDAEAIREPGSLASLKRLEQETFYSQEGGPKDTKEGNRSHRKVLENLKKHLPETQDHLGIFRDKQHGHSRRHAGFNDRWDLMTTEEKCVLMRNKRSVWEIATEPFPEAHFATFPQKLVEPCVLAGCPEGGTVLDPFMGSGTLALVALRLNRNFLGIELNPDYVKMAESRIAAELAQWKLGF